MRSILLTYAGLGLLTSSQLFAQTATNSIDRQKGYDTRLQLTEQSIAKKLEATNIGPTVMSGRVVDLAVDPKNPNHFYAVFASGGLWETFNNGATFSPLFQDQAVMTIGDIAVDWKSGTIWLGSGESNSSRSSYAGNGVYKSTDGGLTWEHLGLEDSHHIGRVVVHPTNPAIAWVASMGHLYSGNSERGIYLTTDGGKTWKQTLFVDENTSAVDLVQDPQHADVLYAAMWERERKAWNFKGNGEGSGIYKSIDGGKTWEKISSGKNGFPSDAGVGRIGLAVSYQNSNKVYALLDNQNRREVKKGKEEKVVTKEGLRKMSSKAFLKLSDDEINAFLDRHNFPNKYEATMIKEKVVAEEIVPAALVDYLEDANAMLFDTPVKGAELYVSEDGGKTWNKTHEGYIDDLYYSYGYYFGNMCVSPHDDDKVYIMGVPILKSADGGKTWKNIHHSNTHADHHALWINSELEGHLVLGNDGGVNISYDDGENWTKCNTLPVGQFYSVAVDNERIYNVYGGLQDNGVWFGPHNYKYSTGWQQEGEYAYKGIMGGDGMQVQIDPRDNRTVYTGYQFGNYYRIDKESGSSKYITPKHELGERPLRFNWQTPIHLSKHNPDVLYMGSHRFHRSLDKGENWEALSDDLTQGGKKGNVPYGTLTSIDESPLRFGLVYVGSDDGLVHVSKDGGYTWQNISLGLDKNQWVSRVEASNHSKSRVYVALNGYRFDNFEPMLYVSENFGSSWKNIGANFPKEPINVVLEDPIKENILYIGTDHAVYVSLDRGESFMLLDENMPRVAIHDLAFQKEAKDLVIGTHGRSIYRMNVKHLQELDQVQEETVHVFAVNEQTYSKRWGKSRGWSQWFGIWEPTVSVPVYAKSAGEGFLTVMDETGKTLVNKEVVLAKGLQYIDYGLTYTSSESSELSASVKKEETAEEATKDVYLSAGKYTIKVEMEGKASETVLVIKEAKKKEGRKPMKKIP
ncbi:glycosyl hydrolase [Limibacter armeniacum]|uniref:WD40/YVTN/BNR-like repeat-containing protein n=1 Tax=Limibacter armeniacum TaxID=466084 RepID=UPI002FE5ACE5